MKPIEQPVFAEIEFPIDPGLNDWIITTSILIATFVLLYFSLRYYRKNKEKLLTFFRYQWLLHRHRHQLDSAQSTVDKVYHLLLAHFNTTLLPKNSQLPVTMQEQKTLWTEYKHKLNTARFNNAPCSDEDATWLVIQCRRWIK